MQDIPKRFIDAVVGHYDSIITNGDVYAKQLRDSGMPEEQIKDVTEQLDAKRKELESVVQSILSTDTDRMDDTPKPDALSGTDASDLSGYGQSMKDIDSLDTEEDRLNKLRKIDKSPEEQQEYYGEQYESMKGIADDATESMSSASDTINGKKKE